jgi:hypothetical protein
VKVFTLAAGLAVGYVLGSRAGREKYEQIVAAARKARNHPTVTQAQQRAKEMLGTATDPQPQDSNAVPATPVSVGTTGSMGTTGSVGTTGSAGTVAPRRSTPAATPQVTGGQDG